MEAPVPPLHRITLDLSNNVPTEGEIGDFREIKFQITKIWHLYRTATQ